MNEKPFFIGWETPTAPPLKTFLLKVVLVTVGLGVAIAGLGAGLQQTIGTGIFEFGNVREFQGIFLKTPVPLLISEDAIGDEHIFYLVKPMKYGLDQKTADELHLRQVTVRGTLIRNEQEAMIEVVDIEPVSAASLTNPLGTEDVPEQATIRGEIVDSKCYLGVMNPGRFKPHRACAIQCIRGGIPPVLVARTGRGDLAHYILVGPEGEAVNDLVLTLVALPIEVTGQLTKVGDRFVLRTDPHTIKKL